jgi:nucleoid-associated protein YgaU
MKKAALIYLALVLGMTAVLTGAPVSIYHWLRSDSDNGVSLAAAAVADLPVQEAGQEVSMATQRPTLVVAPATEPATEVAAQPQTGAADLIAATDPAKVPASRLEKPVVRGGDTGLDRTTSAILAELSILPAVPLTADEVALHDMSQGALAGLAALQGRDTPQTQAPTLESLVVNALRAGQPDAYIDALVNEAAGSGAISVPSALVTADGRVDTAVLLSTLVNKAQVASGAAEQVDPANVVAGGDGVEVRVTASAIGDSTSSQFYTVSPGDSLGSIAQKFYGDAVYFPVIFEANRALLASPDQLSVGQRLVVPPASVL